MTGHVTQKFIDKVIRFGVIDTKRYRYRAVYTPKGHVLVYRISIDCLGRTAVYDKENYEILYTMLNR